MEKTILYRLVVRRLGREVPIYFTNCCGAVCEHCGEETIVPETSIHGLDGLENPTVTECCGADFKFLERLTGGPDLEVRIVPEKFQQNPAEFKKYLKKIEEERKKKFED